MDDRKEHDPSTEVAALLVIERALYYRLSDPFRLAAAYRVVERNRAARKARLDVVQGDPWSRKV